MAHLSRLTDMEAVRTAVNEFSHLGRQAFLAKHGFKESRDYFLKIDEALFDSKPIVAVAFGPQYPEIGTLTHQDLNGGARGAVRALERLHLEVVTLAEINPPKLGQAFENRTEIYRTFGGNKQAGILRFPGEEIVNLFSDASGPSSDDPPTLTKQFGYRGEGLNGPHKLRSGGNALLEMAREFRSPVRFWYRSLGGPFVFLTWVAVIGEAWVHGYGENQGARPEIEWRLQALPGPDSNDWPHEVKAALIEASAAVDDGPEVPEASPSADYLELLSRVEGRAQPQRRDGVVRVDFARSAAARRAVLDRCDGMCESPRCTGMPAERNRRGEPILDVDHILDLSLGGSDHPMNMAALCPNCHASKTRGKNVHRWRSEMAKVAKAAHEAAVNRSGAT